MSGYVYLIGAGCGSMDLMTLRGLSALQKSDVVIYDDLIDEALLDQAPAGAERIYMGKRSGKHSAPQAEISKTIIEKAKAGKTVARLKGGDPFVFGRGGEEALALQKAGIPFEEVPGISSAIAIPAAAGIPVTHRGVSRSFHVITGHTADRADGLPEDIGQLAKLHGTLVFLMGLSHLEQIASALIENGTAPDTPAAVISGGNSAHPATVRAPLCALAAKVREQQVSAPAVILVGQTAALDLRGEKRPLEGICVGLTGTASLSDRLKAGLEMLGARTVIMERSVVDELPVSLDFHTLCDGKTHWLVLTSANGVRSFFRRLKEEKLDIRKLARCKFAVIGAATGKVLEGFGVYPDLCPEVYTSAELAKALCGRVQEGEDVILLRARKAAAILPELLRTHQIPVQECALYDLHADPQLLARRREQKVKLHYLTFSSSSGVELYFKAYGAVPEGTTCVAIGPVTAKALAERLHGPFLTADTISVPGIVQTIIDHQEHPDR